MFTYQVIKGSVSGTRIGTLEILISVHNRFEGVHDDSFDCASGQPPALGPHAAFGAKDPDEFDKVGHSRLDARGPKDACPSTARATR
jgi:hypothetical protein